MVEPYACGSGFMLRFEDAGLQIEHRKTALFFCPVWEVQDLEGGVKGKIEFPGCSDKVAAFCNPCGAQYALKLLDGEGKGRFAIRTESLELCGGACGGDGRCCGMPCCSTSDGTCGGCQCHCGGECCSGCACGGCCDKGGCCEGGCGKWCEGTCKRCNAACPACPKIDCAECHCPCCPPEYYTYRQPLSLYSEYKLVTSVEIKARTNRCTICNPNPGLCERSDITIHFPEESTPHDKELLLSTGILMDMWDVVPMVKIKKNKATQPTQ